MSKSKNSQEIKITQLRFDPENPRFGMLGLIGTLFEDDSTIIQKMIDDERIIDLVISIADQGYFEGEPLLVFKHKEKDTYIVAEGNRRLAALKILNGEFQDVKPSMQEVIDNAIHQPPQVPCIIFKDRSEILHFLGYRHITGVKSWGALEKAIYLKQLKDDLKDKFPTLNDYEIHKKLAREIGSNVTAVSKSLTSLAIYENGFENNSDAFYSLKRVPRSEVKFSLIYTALNFPNIPLFLGLESANDIDLNGFKKDKAKELFSWMFAEDEHGNKMVPESRQLTKLNQVLSSPKAIEVFKESKDLVLAYNYSYGPNKAFFDYQSQSVKLIDQFRRLLRDGLMVENNYARELQILSDEFYSLSRDYKHRFETQSEEE